MPMPVENKSHWYQSSVLSPSADVVYNYNHAFEGFSPSRRIWEGEYEDGTNFTVFLCNKKIIGARFFLKGFEAEMGPTDDSKEFKSSSDSDGHGTHTSSSAAGSAVKGTSFLGYTGGVARGMAPRTRVAIYKACWSSGYCMSSNILAAMDKAIKDNVNVLSISVGFGTLDYHKDGLTFGASAAVERGIFVFVAGNDGPGESTLMNVAPWITTVGVGTVDRDFPAIAILGHRKSFVRVSSLFKGHRGLVRY